MKEHANIELYTSHQEVLKEDDKGSITVFLSTIHQPQYKTNYFFFESTKEKNKDICGWKNNDF